MSNDPNQPPPNQPPPNQSYPSGYAQPGAPGGFAPVPGQQQAPYGAPGGFAAPPDARLPRSRPALLPARRKPLPARRLPTARRLPPALAAARLRCPRRLSTTRRLSAARGLPRAAYAPGYPYQQQPPAGAPYHPGYAPPPGQPPSTYGAPPPQPGYGGYAPPPGPAPGATPAGSAAGGAMPVPGGFMKPPEPPTVLYRDITVHNPRFEGGLSVYGYGREDIKRDCDEIVKYADKDKKLIEILTRLGPLKMEVLAHEFPSHNHKGETLYRLVERKTTRYVEAGLLGLVLGPIRYDAERVRDAIQGLGTKESLLDELILDLSPTDVGHLAYVYEQKYKVGLLQAVQGDLSGNVRKLFTVALDSTRILRPYFPPGGPPPPADPNAPPAAGAEGAAAAKPTGPKKESWEINGDKPQELLEVDVKKLVDGGVGRLGTNEDAFYKILTGRTHEHLIHVCRHYAEKRKKPLSQDIKNEFSGHDRQALLHIVAGAEVNLRYPELDPQAVRDANLLEDTMAGLGTNDTLLVMRILRAHWARRRMDAISAAYLRIHEKTLTRRVQGETSGAFEDLLIAMIKGPQY
ncbi:Annexin A4 [Mycena venus]|uniref:Annexin A4 n=1 Tax=Mycena venus TaxID=2733690 RepID=A0A8H6Y7E0_9AGAR|nr:Annexin A4 [Mycena venus]